MPKGPQGQKRPADVIGAAVMVGKIATGEIEEKIKPHYEARKKAGQKGGKARDMKLDKKDKKNIAHKAAMARWNKK
jgi:hypothetical protein